MANFGFRGSENAPDTYVAITPNNSTLLKGFKELFVVTAGNLELGSVNGGTTSAFAVPAGAHIPFGAGYVRTGTTSTVVGIG